MMLDGIWCGLKSKHKQSNKEHHKWIQPYTIIPPFLNVQSEKAP